MANIFISYATGDEAFTRELSRRLLEQGGHSVFYSGGTLNVGQRWQEEMSKSLREADGVVIIVSQASLDSRWLMTEVGAALGYFQERGRPLVLPVVIDRVDLPPPLTQIQAIFSFDRDLNRIVDQINTSLNALVGRLHAREEEKREAQALVEEKASDYIGESLTELGKKERSYKAVSAACYAVALLALIGGVWFALWRLFTNAGTQPTWQSVVQFAVASIIVIGLLGALSRFAFVLGKSYMVESLRNGDRIHAIKFGYFYLRAFGARAEWSEIKEAFQHWNIDSGSSFINQAAADIDPQIFHTAIEIARTIAGKAKIKE